VRDRERHIERHREKRETDRDRRRQTRRERREREIERQSEIERVRDRQTEEDRDRERRVAMVLQLKWILNRDVDSITIWMNLLNRHRPSETKRILTQTTRNYPQKPRIRMRVSRDVARLLLLLD